jgi:hypothetical protein
MNQMKKLTVLLIFTIVASNAFADQSTTQTNDPRYGSIIWAFTLNVGNPMVFDAGYLPYFSGGGVNSIALPSYALPQGVYYTAYYEFPGVPNGSNATYIYGPSGSGNYSFSTPCTYPFNIHFYVEMDRPNDIYTGNWNPPCYDNVYSWVNNPSFSIIIYESNTSSPPTIDNEATSKIQLPAAGENSWLSSSTKIVYEFDVPAGDFVVITVLSGGSVSYVFGTPSGDQTITQSNFTVPVTMYYALDNAPPAMSQKPPAVKDAIEATDNLGYEIYYANVENKITLTWDAIKDNGTKPYSLSSKGPNNGDTVSGTASYDVWEYANNEFSFVANVPEPQQGVKPEVEIPCNEGEHFYYLTAKDNAGKENRYKYNEITGAIIDTIDSHGNTVHIEDYGPACHVIVDRTAPSDPGINTNQLSPVIMIGNKTYSADPQKLQIKWNKSTDAVSGIDKYTLRIRNITNPANIIEKYPAFTIADPENPSAAISVSQVFATSSPSGKYDVSVMAYDKAGNQSGWGTPAVFYIDQLPPNPPAGSSFSVNGVLGADGGNVIFQIPQTGNSQENINLSLSIDPNLDGTAGWQSGLGSFIVKDDAGITVATIPIQPNQNTATITLPGISRVYKVYSVDKMGNTDSSSARTISFTVLTLGQVTFGPCTYDNATEKYQVTWQPPSGALNLHYKTIVLNAPGTPPITAFNSLPESDNTSALFEGTARDIVYVSVLTRDSSGSVSVTTNSYTLPSKKVPPGAEVLTGDTTWSGTRPMTRSVYVPVGVTLTVEAGCAIPASEDVELIVDGTLIIDGTEANPVTFSYVAGSAPFAAWKGITISGHATIDHINVKNALRGVSVLTGATVTIMNTKFIHNQVGLHIYNDLPVVTGCRFEQCLWYGVKEDAIPPSGDRPVVRACVFTQNGYDYYHDRLKNITMNKLNEINGNTADADKNRKE